MGVPQARKPLKQAMASARDEASGRSRMPGLTEGVSHVPAPVRLGDRAALVKRGLLKGRVLFSSSGSYPLSVFSVLPYDSRLERALHHRRADTIMPIATGVVSSKGESFEHLLHAAWGRCSQCTRRRESRTEHPRLVDYDPTVLDDSTMSHESVRNLVEGEGYIMSILPFRPERVIKLALNEQFRQMLSESAPGLTFTMIRTLRQKVTSMWFKFGGDLCTVALAFVFFDKLVLLKGVVNKENRRLTMACCLLLAFKLNEQQENVVSTKIIPSLVPGPAISDIWGPIEDTLGVHRKQVVKSEFTVFSLLGFSMHLRVAEVMPAFERCIFAVGKTREAYIDNDMWQLQQEAMAMEAEGEADDFEF